MDGLRQFERSVGFFALRHRARRIRELPCDLSERIHRMTWPLCVMRCLPRRLVFPEHLAKTFVPGLTVNDAWRGMAEFQQAVRAATKRASGVREEPVHVRKGAGRTPFFEAVPARWYRRKGARQPGPWFAGGEYPQHGIGDDANLHAGPAALSMNDGGIGQDGRQL